MYQTKRRHDELKQRQYANFQSANFALLFKIQACEHFAVCSSGRRTEKAARRSAHGNASADRRSSKFAPQVGIRMKLKVELSDARGHAPAPALGVGWTSADTLLSAGDDRRLLSWSLGKSEAQPLSAYKRCVLMLVLARVLTIVSTRHLLIVENLKIRVCVSDSLPALSELFFCNSSVQCFYALLNQKKKRL